MAKIGSIQRNNKRKRLAKKYYKKRSEYKEQIYNKNLSLEERFAFVQKLSKLPKNSASIRVRNRCSITGRPRGHVGAMGLSRIMVRKMAGEGLLPGVVKASW